MMRNVTLRHGGEEYKGGLIKSELRRDKWSWDFYDSSQLKWSFTGSGGLRKGAKFFEWFSIDAIDKSERSGNEVTIWHKLFDESFFDVYTLVFASESDAMVFNGEAGSQ